MAAAEVLQPAARLIGLRALVVDDNPICAAVLGEKLGSWGMAVVEANSGTAAMTLLERLEEEARVPGVVIMHQPAHPEEGLALARKIFTDARYAGMPMLLIGPPSDVTPDDMEAAGVAAWLPREFSDMQLLDIVSAVVQSATVPTDPAPPPPELDDDALDPSVISRLRALDSPRRPGFLMKLIDRYIHSAAEHMDEMRSALDAGDSERLRVSAHSLKGSSLNLGAHRLAAVCAELEDRARDRKLDVTAEGLLARAAYELEQAKAALRTLDSVA